MTEENDMTEEAVLEPPETEKINEEPSRVMVKNDDVNSFDHVTETFMQVIGMNEEKAFTLALTIHEQGIATVFEGHYERAEFIYEQLKAAKLDAKLD